MKLHTVHKPNGKRRRRLARQLDRTSKAKVGVDAARHSPRAIIYRSEFEYVAKCICDRNDIETGGQLFGHWTSDGTPVILYAIGPGPDANHRATFFQQDINYLVKVGRLLRKRFGLHHIGEWHSHHQLGMDRPSRYDIHTMTSVIRDQDLGSFLLCIGTYSAGTASLRGFLCDRSRCVDMDWEVITARSPIREEADRAFADVLVHPRNMLVTEPIRQLTDGQ